jgi:hypothetical protein
MCAVGFCVTRISFSKQLVTSIALIAEAFNEQMCQQMPLKVCLPFPNQKIIVIFFSPYPNDKEINVSMVM